MQAVGYVRVSTERQAVEGISLAAQWARIEAWSGLRSVDLVGFHAVEVIRGRTADNRPGEVAYKVRCPA